LIEPILTVSGVGKSFRTYAHETQRVLGWLGFGQTGAVEHWVLRDIDFSIMPGEAVAIVGENGAGKSTLLKIVTGTLRPSRGSVGVHGKLAAILELGLGFNPDLSGRQNAFHVAGLMGHPHEAIVATMPAIEAFAEIGDYFDQPVRVYSSGMQMRVAFAVVTAFRPDILIVDEALAVGDTYFQHKSMEKIRSFRREGTALILVSHDKNAIQSICDRVLLLDRGAIARDGAPTDVMDYYNALIAKKTGEDIKEIARDDGSTQTISGTGEVTVETVEILDASGKPAETVAVGSEVELRVTVKVRQAVPRLVFGYAIKNRLGQVIYGTNTHHYDCPLAELEPGELYGFAVRFQANLGVGSYSISISLTDADVHLSQNFEWRDLAAVFSVVNTSLPVFDGLAWLQPVISTYPLPREVMPGDDRS
jgi:lipopolysaccharide transport system ATP-binding protein